MVNTQAFSFKRTFEVELKLETIDLDEQWQYYRVHYELSGKHHYRAGLTTRKNVEAFKKNSSLHLEDILGKNVPTGMWVHLVTKDSQLDMQVRGAHLVFNSSKESSENILYLTTAGTTKEAYDTFEAAVQFLDKHADSRIVFFKGYNHRVFSSNLQPLKMAITSDSSVLYHDMALDLTKSAEALAATGQFHPVDVSAETLSKAVSPKSLIKDIPYYNRSEYSVADIPLIIRKIHGMPMHNAEEDEEYSETVSNSKYLTFAFWPSDAQWEQLIADSVERTSSSLLEKAQALGMIPLVDYQGYIG
jgi:hypothetical protein